MKKLFSLLMVIVVLVSVLGVAVTKARAAGPIISFDSAGFIYGKGVVFTFIATEKVNVKNAGIYAGSDWYKLSCVYKKEDGTIVCVAVGGLTQFAGQTGIITLGGQIFWVIIPGKGIEKIIAITCTQPEVSGALVLFETTEGFDGPFFVPGKTLQDVADTANNWIDGQFWTDFSIQGGLTCGEAPQ